MASSSRSWRYDVFPSFRGEDVRKSFLSYLLKEFDRKSIITFADHGIKRSRPISQQLLFAIRESRIAVVVFSKNYASSTWCLNELVEIHNCYMEFDQLVIPVFYDVDPSDVRKQTGEFGEAFGETCRNKTDNEKQRWIRALADVANMAGEDLRNWDNEANIVEKIANDVSNKLITPSNGFADYVGIEGHIGAMNSMLCLESGGVRMVGIVGPSGIGKTVIARALFNQLSSQFHYRVFLNDYRRTNRDEYDTKLCWEQRFLSEILCQKDLNINCFGVIEQRLKNKKVLIVLNDVDNVELLTTVVGQTGWFGSGSRVIVITQDKQLLKAHKIEYVYEVDFPSEDLAFQMLCRRAFGQNSPLDGFADLAVEVANLAGKLPLGLSVLGSSLKGKDKEEWMEMLPRLRNSMDRNIVKTLRVSYDGLHGEDQDIFLYIACLFNRQEVSYITSLLGVTVNFGLKVMANKSLIRITPPHNIVEMHNLLQILGREIVRAESKYPGERRFLVDAEDIRKVLKSNTGTENVLAIDFIPSRILKPFILDEKSFQRMHNVRYLKFYPGWSKETGKVLSYLPEGLVCLPRKLRLLDWSKYPLKCMPSNFSGKYLVVLEMQSSKLEKLWEGTQPLGRLKKINMAFSRDLKEIPDLSNTINLEQLILQGFISLVTLPPSIQNLNKLMELDMKGCSKLEVLPTGFNLQSLYYLNLEGCSRLRSFPQISMNIATLFLNDTEIEEDCFWIENIYGLTKLYWNGCLMRCMPFNFPTKYLVELRVENSKLEKLWEGDKLLGSLRRLDLSGSENLKEIPDLSHAHNLKYLVLIGCKSLVMLPSSIRNLHELMELNMRGCTSLELLPTDVNLESLEFLTLSECSRLRFFPKISTRTECLDLSHTAIQDVPSWIKNISELVILTMSGCKRLKSISPNILKLKRLHMVDFSDCEGLLPTFPYTELHTKSCESRQGIRIPHSSLNPMSRLEVENCFNVDQDATELILQLDNEYSLIPGSGEVPINFTHRASGSSLVIPLHKSFLSEGFLCFKACILLESLTSSCCHYTPDIEVRWYFRAKTGMLYIDAYMDTCKMDHLALFQIWFPTKEVNDPPPELDYNYLEFHFYYCSNRFRHECDMDNCPSSTQRIKGCGVRIWDVYPSPDSTLNSLQKML